MRRYSVTTSTIKQMKYTTVFILDKTLKTFDYKLSQQDAHKAIIDFWIISNTFKCRNYVKMPSIEAQPSERKIASIVIINAKRQEA